MDAKLIHCRSDDQRVRKCQPPALGDCDHRVGRDQLTGAAGAGGTIVMAIALCYVLVLLILRDLGRGVSPLSFWLNWVSRRN